MDTQPLLDGAPPATAPVPTSIVFTGDTGEIFRIWLLNLALNIVTLGIYSFWGRTRMRRYVTARFSLVGDAFEYTGTGKELFLGFLLVLPFLIGFGFGSTYVQRTPTNFADDAVFYLALYFLFQVGFYASLRYRLSRTVWRGIRCRLTGSAWMYGLRALLFGAITVVTIGLFIPMTDGAQARYRMGNVWFGNTRATFAPKVEDDLWGTHIVTLFLVLPTLGLARIWYGAALQRYSMNGLSVGQAGFHVTYTGGRILKFTLANLLILILTLGLGMAWVIRRNATFMAQNTFLTGDVEAAAQDVTQSQERLGKTGEGIGGILDADVGMV